MICPPVGMPAQISARVGSIPYGSPAILWFSAGSLGVASGILRASLPCSIHPSVDDPKFSASLCFPKQIPNGGIDMSVRWPAQAEFHFLELYADAAEALTRVVTLLRELKTIQRFA
jgi:hypothetical protein